MTSLSKESVTERTLDEADAGQRLDNFLMRILKGVPKSHIYRIIRNGEVRINKKRAQAQHRLNAGDIVRIPPIRLSHAPSDVFVPPLEAACLFEDEHLLIINKPAGLAVHGGSGVQFGVIEQLRAARPNARYLELVHRLDRETSGILIIAKKRAALVNLHEQFRSRHPDKRYLALAIGEWAEDKRDIKAPLLKYLLPNGERAVKVHEDGKASHTRFQKKQTFFIENQAFTLLEARLFTGRTHQIRVHLNSVHTPIAGDEKYGHFEWNKHLSKLGLKRMFLHASRLSFMHPILNERLHITAPLPQTLQTFLERISPCNSNSSSSIGTVR